MIEWLMLHGKSILLGLAFLIAFLFALFLMVVAPLYVFIIDLLSNNEFDQKELYLDFTVVTARELSGTVVVTGRPKHISPHLGTIVGHGPTYELAVEQLKKNWWDAREPKEVEENVCGETKAYSSLGEMFYKELDGPPAEFYKLPLDLEITTELLDSIKDKVGKGNCVRYPRVSGNGISRSVDDVFLYLSPSTNQFKDITEMIS